MAYRIKMRDADKELVKLANTLLQQLHIREKINSLDDITSIVYVTLFEGLCGEQLHDIIRHPITKEDEIHNAQIVIDSLSSEVLHTSLSHISGRLIVEGDRTAISNLLEIFSGLLDYILNKIESDISMDNETDREMTFDDPDAVTPEIINEVLQREMRKSDFGVRDVSLSNEIRNDSSLLRSSELPQIVADQKSQDAIKSNFALNDTNELIALGDETFSVDASRSADETGNLIMEAEQFERQLEMANKKFSNANVQQKLTLESKYRGKSQVKSQNYIQSNGLTQNDRGFTNDSSDKSLLSDFVRAPRYTSPSSLNFDNSDKSVLSDLLRPQGYQLPNDLYKKYDLELKTQQPSPDLAKYEALEETLEQTAKMARAALRATNNDAVIEGGRNLYELKLDTLKNRAMAIDETLDDFARSLNMPSLSSKIGSTERLNHSAGDGGVREDDYKTSRKVSFFIDKSNIEDKENRRTNSLDDLTNNRKSYRSSGNKKNDSYDKKLKKQFNELISDDFEKLSVGKQTGQCQTHEPVTNISFVDRQLKKEDDHFKSRADYLKKIYKEDYDEIVGEVNDHIKKELKLLKNTESDFKAKLHAKSKPKSKAHYKTKSVIVSKKGRPIKPAASTQVSNYVSAPNPSEEHKPVNVSDDGLLPELLKEFPHLYLSPHTWHELWRKGLSEIEQITRSHQEVRNKKQRAQTELKDAEKRQQILINIVKKELDHAQRLRDIKDRKASEIAVKNKIHDKRIQTNKCKKYYTDYDIRQRSRVLRKRTREEMIFKKLFKEGLDIQKERVKELKKYSKEQREIKSEQQRNALASLENYYKDHFDILLENMAREKHELQVREKAQQRVVGQMKRELKKKMEREIVDLQEQMYRDEDDEYFRQLDADRVKHELHLVKYHSKA